MRAAGLTGRLEALRVLLGSVLGSAPALQQLLITRDAALFLTLRKLVGLVWFGFGLVWVRFGLVWFGLVWFGLVWFGLGLVGASGPVGGMGR